MRSLTDEFDLSINEIETIKASGARCMACELPFTDENVFTNDGWRETLISRMCEKCFDMLLSEEDDESD